MNSAKAEEFSRWWTEQIAAAREKGGKLHKVRAGWYLVVLPLPSLVEIEQLNYDEPHDLNGWWIARDPNGYGWYSDPKPTLKELKRSLGIKQETPTQ